MPKHAVFFWLIALSVSAVSVALTFALYPQVYYPMLTWDEWGGVEFYFDKGFWSSVACLHNYHVVVMPKILTRILFIATDADPFIRGLSTLLSATLLGAIVGYVSSRAVVIDGPGGRLVRYARFWLALAFTLWLVCYQQLYWGMATYSYFSLLFGFAAVASLDIILQNRERPGVWMLLPGLLAAASTLSFSYGVAAWGALAVMLFLRRQAWRDILGTLAVGLGLIAALRLCYAALSSLIDYCT